METNNDYRLIPTFGNSFGTGWKVMSDNFIRLLLIVIVVAIVSGPSMINFKFDAHDFRGGPWDWAGDFHSVVNWASLGIIATFLAIVGMLFTLFVLPVFQYGADMTFVQAVRRIKPDFELLIRGFWQNYLHIVLANLLVTALIVMGCFALLIPGIIIACRLVFVSYIVMDKKLDPIEAVELSWKLTRGHGWRIFAMGFISIFIILFGLILFIVGVFPAIIWVSSAFASLYQSVLNEKEKPAEPVPVAA